MITQEVYNVLSLDVFPFSSFISFSPFSPFVAVAARPSSFAAGLNFYKLFWVFTVGCFLGVVIETLWCRIRYHKWESRRGLVLGPFNLVYGFGALVMTLGLYPLRGVRDLFVFAVGTILGGVYEYVCSVVQEKVVGTVSWDYRSFPLNLHGRINLLYCFFWGILALLWERDLYPHLSGWIERIPDVPGVILSWVGVAFFLVDTVLSALVICRAGQRKSGIPAKNALFHWIDRRYPDARVTRIYPNMTFSGLSPRRKEGERLSENP